MSYVPYFLVTEADVVWGLDGEQLDVVSINSADLVYVREIQSLFLPFVGSGKHPTDTDRFWLIVTLGRVATQTDCEASSPFIVDRIAYLGDKGCYIVASLFVMAQ